MEPIATLVFGMTQGILLCVSHTLLESNLCDPANFPLGERNLLFHWEARTTTTKDEK